MELLRVFWAYRMARCVVPAGLAACVMAACSSSSTPAVHGGADADLDAHLATDAKQTKDAHADAGHKPGHDGGGDATSQDASVGAPDVHPDVIIDPKNCVAPGATSSENGIGGYCSPKGGQCVHAGVGGSATLCTADFGAPPHEWFCTITCSMTSDCGAGGGQCLQAPFAEICVPTACSQGLGDASSSVVDALVHDGSADVHTDGAGGGDAGEADAAARDGGARDGARDGSHDAARARDAAEGG